MTTFTKQTICTYQIDIGSLSPFYKDEGLEKLSLLEKEGKTLVFGYTFDDPYTIRRPWLDQAAAEEWVAFVTNLASDDQVTIVSIEIVDSTLVG
jgi:hypothetical protein